jgi:transcriptional regulator with XRE-family HTH domain
MEDTIRSRIAYHAKRLRQENAWSQEAAAELGGMTARTWRRVERGPKEPTTTTLLTLAQVAIALSVDPAELLAPVPPPKPHARPPR